MRFLAFPVLLAVACVPEETPPPFGESNGLAACTDDTLAANPGKRCFTFRALTGASMGGGAAARIGFSHPELFDSVGVLGTPLADLDALWDMVRTNHLAGFCSLEELQRDPTAFCGVHDVVPASYEGGYVPAVDDNYATPDGRCPAFRSDFNHWYRGTDEGRGTSFDREFFIEIMLDLIQAYGSPLGDPAHSREWNPEGTTPLVVVKDGGDVESGDFDPAFATREIAFLKAVDLNENGVRDYAEPVIVNDRERGTPDAFDDDGLDGVPGTGDFGEGNGVYDISPGLAKWRARSPSTAYAKMSDAQVNRLSVWIDAGIRDFLNSAQITNRMFDAIKARGADTRFFQGFRELPGRPDGRDYSQAFLDTSVEALGRVAYMQYGDPSVCPASDDLFGDGNHVGPEIIDRIYTAFTFAAARMPEDDRRSAIGGDVGDLGGPTGSLEDFAFLDHFDSDALGREVEYGVLLPPDYYFEPDRRWPVIYFLHGQGDSPQKLLGMNFLLFGPMKESSRPDRQAEYLNDMARAIVIFPDGRCLDDCFTGTNFADFDDGGPAFEQATLELMRVVEGRYRTLAPRLE